MAMYADDNAGLYPESGGTIGWGQIDQETFRASWMEQINSYVQNTNTYHCPANKLLPVNSQSPFNYFNGVRAAYIAGGGVDVSVDSKKMLFPSAQVLSGDTLDFQPVDADKDDYTQNCVGGPDNGFAYETALGVDYIWEDWQAHNLGQNVLFADGHAKWYKGYDANEMTFRYDSMNCW